MTAADVLLLAALADVVGLYGLADALRRGVAAGVPVRESWAAHTARAVARARPGWVRRPGPWWARKLLAVGAPAPPLARHERALLLPFLRPVPRFRLAAWAWMSGRG